MGLSTGKTRAGSAEVTCGLNGCGKELEEESEEDRTREAELKGEL